MDLLDLERQLIAAGERQDVAEVDLLLDLLRVQEARTAPEGIEDARRMARRNRGRAAKARRHSSVASACMGCSWRFRCDRHLLEAEAARRLVRPLGPETFVGDVVVAKAQLPLSANGRHGWMLLHLTSAAPATGANLSMAGTMSFRALAVGLVAALAPSIAFADPCEGELPSRAGATFSGTVRYVGDGDSLCVGARDPSTWIEVRLADFNAPELNAAGGRAAKALLERIALGRVARCTAGGGRGGRVISYDRVIATCRVDGRRIGDLLREAGAEEGGR